MTTLRSIDSCDQHAGDPTPAHGPGAADARTVSGVQPVSAERQDRRWLHPAWIATDGGVRNLVRKALDDHDGLTAWAARVGITRQTLTRLLDSPQGAYVGDLALLPTNILLDVLDAWRAEIARVGALHRPLHDLLSDVVRETSDVAVSVLRKDESAVTTREIDEAITALQALRARRAVTP